MVQFMRKGQLFPEQVASHGFKLSNIYLVEKSNLRLLPHCKIGATFHIRRKFHPQVTTQFCVNSTISEAYSLLLNTGTDGASKTERSRNKFFFSRTAEGHESLDTEDVGVSANEVPCLSENQRWIIVKQKIAGLLSNAEKLSQGSPKVRHSLAVDFGDVKTGLSISLKGYAPRPLTVLRFRGDKLIEQLMEVATREKVDEFIVGLPRTSDGRETEQSNKTRSFAGRLAGQAALRGWRVYLLDEYGTSRDGLDYMLEILVSLYTDLFSLHTEEISLVPNVLIGFDRGLKKRFRKEKIDAYAALILLSSYFGSKGAGAQLVVPKGLAAQEQLCLGSNLLVEDNVKSYTDYDFDDDDNYEYYD
ncbi:hypothetical protein AXG93_3104s1020 [Marchantia polymorpha subsp. ruderalis]|uniref:YqgF/RNase H-like domain-containing protein n=1 Tax=Marchantia polymorpha subsp. ruderalis TaxID=1480154 RepID=A0A176WR63_MARPO|nr:hypothetical protein AXG93_3104s1020 [Marchantia polymorpha subsp. ruderalis]